VPGFFLLLPRLPEVLRCYPERPVEFTRGIFPGNNRSQFDYCCLIKMCSEFSEQRFADILIRQRDRVCVTQGNTLNRAEQTGIGIFVDSGDLFGADTQFAAHGSIDITSEQAAIERCYSAVDQ